jgi:hypothetical protein
VSDIEFAADVIPTLGMAERMRYYREISRVSTLFRLDGEYSWTEALPDGGFWFQYSNLWKQKGERDHIVNTHVTALRIAANMFALARIMNITSDVDFWRNVVYRGTDGLLWFVADPANWGAGAGGVRELNYAVGARPHGSYHLDIIREVQSLLSNGLLEYKKAEVMAALSLK